MKYIKMNGNVVKYLAVWIGMSCAWIKRRDAN
jgi:hypothetical protein